MNNNRLTTLITGILQQNNINPGDNQLFSVLSLLLLLQITDIYQIKQTGTAKLNNNSENENTSQALPENTSGLLGQLQGGDNNLQQLLPVLMGSLGGGNNNLDISKIAGLLQNLNQNNNKNKKSSNIEEKEGNQEENSKKKAMTS